MINTVLIGVITLTLIVSASLGYMTLTRMKSSKREFFVLFVFCVVVYEFGYILEMTASTTDGGLIATKIMYIGSSLIAPLFLVFVQKYCEVSIHKAINFLLFAIAFGIILLVWTSDFHTLYYTSYWYDDISEVHHLGITRGVLYPLGYLHPVICVAISCVILVKEMTIAQKGARIKYGLLIFGAMAPVLTYTLYFLDLNLYGANYAPIFLMASMIALYYGIIKHDLLDNEETIRSQNWLKEMIGNISHDLKTPLAVMSVNLETLAGLTETQNSTDYQRYVRVAYHKNMDLQRLIQNLFDVTRIETGRNIFNPKWKSMLWLLSQVKVRHDDYLEEKEIVFEVNTGDGDYDVFIDPQKIHSVFDNIIYNAARYTPSGGSIIISAEILDNDKNKSMAVISVTDTGCGIAPEHIPHIFERFYKASASRGSEDGDSGLGLYIVKNVVESSGGSVEMESELGKGTSVILKFLAKPK